MNKKEEKSLASWETFLDGTKTEIHLSLKEILEEVKNANENIRAMWFQYQWYSMEIDFSAINSREIVLSRTINILSDKIKSKHPLTEGLFEKVTKMNYDTEYIEKREKIFRKWFVSCWRKVKRGYKYLPETGYSVHYANGGREDITSM